MSDAEIQVFIRSFGSTGFSWAINWYRNLNRNWHARANVKPKTKHSTLTIYAEKDVITKSQTLKDCTKSMGRWFILWSSHSTRKA